MFPHESGEDAVFKMHITGAKKKGVYSLNCTHLALFLYIKWLSALIFCKLHFWPQFFFCKGITWSLKFGSKFCDSLWGQRKGRKRKFWALLLKRGPESLYGGKFITAFPWVYRFCHSSSQYGLTEISSWIPG